jgi:hypothetical protein
MSFDAVVDGVHDRVAGDAVVRCFPGDFLQTELSYQGLLHRALVTFDKL